MDGQKLRKCILMVATGMMKVSEEASSLCRLTREAWNLILRRTCNKNNVWVDVSNKNKFWQLAQEPYFLTAPLFP